MLYITLSAIAAATGYTYETVSRKCAGLPFYRKSGQEIGRRRIQLYPVAAVLSRFPAATWPELVRTAKGDLDTLYCDYEHSLEAARLLEAVLTSEQRFRWERLNRHLCVVAARSGYDPSNLWKLFRLSILQRDMLTHVLFDSSMINEKLMEAFAIANCLNTTTPKKAA